MSRMNRREFLRFASAAAAAAALRPKAVGAPAVVSTRSPNNKLNMANIGVGGRGGAHLGTSASENLVALCDADARTLDRVAAKYPAAKKFTDYRELFDKMHKEIDAVFVATPDHHHAPASMLAIQHGKHVYCEKPLTHTIHEARALALAARQQKVATQMGNQGRAEEGWRVLCEIIWAGVIGNVKEVHVWTDRPGIPTRFWWPQGASRPAGSETPPEGLNWDVWLGPAPQRPYMGKWPDGKFQGKNVYHPFVWRGWWDFGTGALGDIGCHAMSGIFTALKIEHALAVECVKDSGTTQEMFPENSIIKWSIPARGDMPPCEIYWYDGANTPPRELAELAAGKEMPDNGQIVVGDKGKLWVTGGGPRLIPEGKMRDFKKPQPTIPRCESDHHGEWIAACKGGRAAFSNFDHAGPLTEMVLLGNFALRAGLGRRVDWDGPNMKVTNLPALNRHIRKEYRTGWTV